ncbi:hypothetical protein KNE206_43230 [Kitasatospora sp. NE20-6]
MKLSVEARSPSESSRGPLDMQHQDVPGGLTYEYDLHPSGALRILRVFEDTPHAAEACFGPGVRLEATGTYLRSGSEY